MDEKYVWLPYRVIKSITIKCQNMPMFSFSRNSIPKPKTCHITLNDFIPIKKQKGRVPRVSTLVGSANETHVHIEGVRTQALLDTGSSVSTISQSFYETHLSHLPLQPVKTLMSLECVDGSALPYLGFIACELQVAWHIRQTRDHR